MRREEIALTLMGDICIIAGLGIVIYGAYMIFPPMGYIIGGVGVAAIGYGLIRPHIKRK